MGPTSIVGDLTYSQYNRLPHVIDGNSNRDEDLLKAAQQFESLFIDMWLKSARDANQVIAKDNLMQSQELQLHQEMRDHEMAVHMSQQGGIGLAEVIVRQLKGGACPPFNCRTITSKVILIGRAQSMTIWRRSPAVIVIVRCSLPDPT